jgi:hypothetical protein
MNTLKNENSNNVFSNTYEISIEKLFANNKKSEEIKNEP